jgi:hypothetical protein
MTRSVLFSPRRSTACLALILASWLWVVSVIALAVPPTCAQAQVLSAPTSVNFGALTCTNGIITTTLAIQNTGTFTLTLSGAAVSPTNADFSIVSPTGISALTPIFVNPGSTQAIVVAYNPARLGSITASLVLASNALNAQGGINSVQLFAQRDSSGFVLSTTNLAFTRVPINTASTSTLTLANTGTLPFSLQTPLFSGAFVIDSMTPNPVLANNSAQIAVRFFGAPAGITTATTFLLNDQCGRVTPLVISAAVQSPPSITSISPRVGTVGTPVIITGTNFSNATAVFFGGVAAHSFRVESPTQILAVVSQGSTGLVSVSVAGSIASSPQVFTFVPQPSVLFVTPLTGGTGTTVTIIGTNLEGASSVAFGGTPAQSFRVDNPTQITAIVGAGASGNVSVTTPASTTTSTQQFVYIPAPNVLFITPQSGAVGTVVTVIGTNLDNTRSVSFGGIAAQSFAQISPTQLSAVIGAAGASGSVTVTTPGGTSSSQQQFVFSAPPAITFVSPVVGGLGTIVNIIGANFANVSGVSFGGVPAQSFIVSSPSQIIATVGTGTSGAITITTQSGTATALQQFTFAAPPTIAAFTPTSGGAGTTVNIFGSLFSGATTVTFGGIPVRSFSVVSPTQIVAVVGQGASGAIGVVTGAGVGFSQQQFGYLPTSVIEHSTTKALLEAVPNPANDVVTLRYTLWQPAVVKLELFSMLGERVCTMEASHQMRNAGTHSVSWNVEHLPQGVYSCRLYIGGSVQTVLLRVVR